MKIYWIWVIITIAVWSFAVVAIDHPLGELTMKFFGLAGFFALFFILPIFSKSHRMLGMILTAQIILAGLILHPVQQTFNSYLLLVLSLLLAEGFFRLRFVQALGLSIVGLVILLVQLFLSNIDLLSQSFMILCYILLVAGLSVFKTINDRYRGIDSRYQAMVSEYRELKRRNTSEEEVARQEERVLIAHEIHDSVGHKLTALLMQLEMFRLKAPQQNQQEMNTLKKLAQESLDETRSAVRSLKTTDTGGLPGIMRLIRKLERESFLNIHFSVKHGAFTAPLTGEQSFVIYRVVQEALTNTMKHSQAREASVHFEAPGGSVFRFQISNPTTDENARFQEGFGLSSMRERLEKYGGELDVYKTTKEFVISGYIKIGYGGEVDDSDSSGGRSSDGATRTENDD